MRTASDIDSLISAQIPDPQISPVLHEIVEKMMVDPVVCLAQEMPAFQLSDNDYPNDQRLDNECTVVVKCQDLVNRWVVPYNLDLLKNMMPILM